MDDETIRLILDMGGSAATVEAVRAKLEALRGSVHSTADTYGVLERQVGEYDVLERRVTETTRTAVQAEARQVDMLRALGLQVESAAVAAAGAGKALGKGGDFGRGVMSASFAVQDFTSVLGTQGLGRALGAVQNNIPMLLASLGAGAGLAGTVSLVSIGVGLLIDNWDKVAGRWKEGETERETERQKKLKAAIEGTREAAEKLAGTHTPEHREQEGRIRRAVDAFGGQAVLKELQEALVARSGSFGAEADRLHARNLFTNLMQGHQPAWELLGDLPLRGGVGQVLRGGKTPMEEAADRREVQARQEREGKEFRERKAREAEQEREEREQLAEEARKGRERVAKQQEDREEKEKADAGKAAHEQAQAQGKANDAALQQAQGTSIDEEAAALMAGVRGQGGVHDRFGRERAMTPDQQAGYVYRQVEAELKRRFPGMAAQQRSATASKITRDARKGLDEKLRQGVVRGLDSGLDAVQATQAAMMATVRELNELAQRARQLQRDGRAMRQRQQPLMNGGW